MSKRRRRRHRHSIGGPVPPRGAHRLPIGGYQLPGHTSQFRENRGRSYGITVSGVVRDEIDIRRFTQALLDAAKRLHDEKNDKAA